MVLKWISVSGAPWYVTSSRNTFGLERYSENRSRNTVPLRDSFLRTAFGRY